MISDNNTLVRRSRLELGRSRWRAFFGRTENGMPTMILGIINRANSAINASDAKVSFRHMPNVNKS